MAHFYATTAHKATAVSCSIKCSFLSPEDENLVVAKGNRLEVYEVFDAPGENEENAEEGNNHCLKMVIDVPIFGTIVGMHAYKPQTGSGGISRDKPGTHNLFILTEKKYYSVLSYDAEKKCVVKRACESLNSVTGRESKYIKSCTDPNNRMIAVHLCDGHIKILPISSGGGFSEPFDLRIVRVTRLIDMVFLFKASKPLLALLHEDDVGNRRVLLLTVDAHHKEYKEFTRGVGSQPALLERSTHRLIGAPTGGYVSIGTGLITYTDIHDQNRQSVSMEQMNICAHTCIGGDSEDGSSSIRYLLGNTSGTLYTLALCRDTSQTIFAGTNINATGSSSSHRSGVESAHPITSVTMDYVGQATVASSLALLKHNLVFIGSCYGDSQLVQLLTTPTIVATSTSDNNSLPSWVKLIEEYTNIGPILDMAVVGSDRQGQDVLVTCSGHYEQGSLRVVRSGIGITTQAQVDLPGIKGIWSLLSRSPGADSAFDKYLVQTFLGETRVLSIDGEDMEECELDGLDADAETLFCGDLQSKDTAVQVTASQTRLLTGENFQMTDSFTPSSRASATLATSCGNTLAIAYAGGGISLLEVPGGATKFTHIGSTELNYEVACLSILHLGSRGSNVVEHESSDGYGGSILACGMWTDDTVRLLALPSLTEISSIKLGLDTQARDVLLVSLGDGDVAMHYLMAGLGDGTLIIYSLSLDGGLPAVVDRRIMNLGTRAITLQTYVHNGATCVFATGDRTTIVHWQNKKLMFTVVNVSETTGIARFHSELFPGCLALTSSAGLLIGAIDDIQRLHVQTHKVDGDPHRIAYHAAANTYAVCTEKDVRGFMKGQVLFLSEGTFQQFHSYELQPLEQVTSCVVGSLDLQFDGTSKATGNVSTQTNSDANENSSSMMECFIVGTSVLTKEDSGSGRLLVFSVTSSQDGSEPRVALVAQYETKGNVYDVCSVRGMVAVGIDECVKIYALVSTGDPTDTTAGSAPGDLTSSSAAAHFPSARLQYKCGYSGFILALRLRSQGDIIVTGDLMRSITLLKLETSRKTDSASGHEGSEIYRLTEVARDQQVNFIRAITNVTGDYDDHYLGADDHGNIFCVRRRLEAATEEDRARMGGQAEFHTGEYINVFKHGSLSSQPSESSTQSQNTQDSQTITRTEACAGKMLYGAVSGMVGSIITIDEQTYSFFMAVQKAILMCVPSVGGLPHDKWRGFRNERRTCVQRNVIDGDIVETLLENIYDKKLLEDIALHVNCELNKPASGAETSANRKSSALSLSASAKSDAEFKYTVDDIMRRTEEISRSH